MANVLELRFNSVMNSNPLPPDRAPSDALRELADLLKKTEVRPSCNARDWLGRVLAQAVVADRDSPAADVSAMDGYAIRLADLQADRDLIVSGQCVPGLPPPIMPTGSVLRIFTGAVVPAGCEAVIKREDSEETHGAIRFRPSALAAQSGEHVRRAGENTPAGSVVLAPGIALHTAHLATMENFGCSSVDLYEPVRVSIITTGDEVGEFFNDQPQPWQLRNSNRIALSNLMKAKHWITDLRWDHCPDDPQSLTKLLQARLAESDAVILTGGVSMGDYDYVPGVVREVGGEVVFHGLPLRPGKPILGAATSTGKLIVGLPGNPVSATVGCRRMVLPLLAKMSGQSNWLPPCPTLRLLGGGDKAIPLYWMRLVRLTGDGVCESVISQGSGDLVSLGNSDGFVEMPPGAVGEGPWPFYSW